MPYEKEKRELLRKQFEELCKPVMKFLGENYNPHTKIIIDVENAEMVSGEMLFMTDKFIPD